jgi:hypothetical protein
MFRAMRSFVAWVLVGLVAMSAGCKKDAGQKKEEAPAIASANVEASGVVPRAPQCQKLCLIVGKCAHKDGKCFADSEASCRASVACKAAGLCMPKDGLCIAVSNADCEKSDFCAAKGNCVVVNGKCENASNPPGSASAAPGASAAPAASK